MTYALVLHGGAGARPGTDYSAQNKHMAGLIAGGQEKLIAGVAALDVVAWAVEELEASGLYVAGKGSAPHSLGGFELDASIMHGPSRRAGAVAAIEGIQSPIRAALSVLEDDRHVMLAGHGAQLAYACGACRRGGQCGRARQRLLFAWIIRRRRVSCGIHGSDWRACASCGL